MAPALSSSFYTAPQKSPINPFKPSFEIPNFLKFRKPIFEFKQKKSTALTAINCSKSGRTSAAPATNSNSSVTDPSSAATNGQRHWIVVVKPPSPQQAVSKPDVIDYYVKLLDRVLGSEKEAQGCIYNASYETDFGFCCDLDEETSQELACLPEVLSVKPDPDFNSIQKNYSNTNVELGSYNNIFSSLFPVGSSKHWLVRVEVPTSGVITRAQLVEYYAQILTKVLGNNKDAEMCMYHISQQSDYGFCCELDDECAKELASLPGVLSVRPDENVESDNKDYRENQPTNIKTKKLFVTGLSFYTSEKTLRAAFEGFGELVEVKIIMDKISKRSKGFAFIEYTTEEAASAALREMNGKIINGWMIVVDVAKTDPPKYARGRPRPTR